MTIIKPTPIDSTSETTSSKVAKVFVILMSFNYLPSDIKSKNGEVLSSTSDEQIP